MYESNLRKVVFCKDCKYRQDHHYEEPGQQPYIKHSCKFSNYSMSDEGFCSMGVEKSLVEKQEGDDCLA